MYLVLELSRAMRTTAAGFTLIEIMIVVALVAVMAGISTPVVAGAMARYNVTSAAQQVASTIRSARFQAVGRNARLRIVFTSSTRQYSRQVWDPVDAAWEGVTQAGNAGTDAATLPVGVSFATGVPANLEFGTDGRPTAAATITVTKGDSTANRTISVATSGRVTVQ